MRDVSPEFLSAVHGSNSPVVTVDFWLGGDIVRAGLKPVAGYVEYDATRDVEGRLSLSVLDTESEGSRLSGVIHSIGMRANVRAGFDIAGNIETVSMGWFDLSETTATDAWIPVADDAIDPEFVKTSSTINVEGLDLMSVVAASNLLEPMQPAEGADAWETIADLCAGIVSVLDPGFEPRTLPENLVFEWGRLDGVKEIARLWDARPVMTDAGQLTLARDDSGPAIDDFGVRINVDAWKSKTTSRDLRNGVRFLGKTPEGVEIVGTATESTGLARWGGNFGMRPLRAASEIMDTQDKVDQAAKTRLETEIKSRSVTQSCGALWHPGVELRDRPRLILPDGAVNSQIVGYTLPLTGGPMHATLRLPMVL